MGKSESLEFSEIGKYSSDTELNSHSKNRACGDGCYVSTTTGLILIFLAVVLAIGVGLIVHFTGNSQQLECECTYPESIAGTGAKNGGPPTATCMKPSVEQCKEWILEGNTDICTACTSMYPSVSTSSSLSTSLSTTSAPPINKDVRLPLAMYPDLYTVELQPNMYDGEPEDFTFNGSVKIRMECKQNTKNITLHTNKLNITAGSIMVMGDNSGSIPYTGYHIDIERQFLIVSFENDLVQGNFYTIQMSFIGPLKNDLVGLYLSSYQRGNDTIHIAVTQFQATDARKTFPCFDEPAIKARFDITLVRKSHMVSLSNMPNISHEDRGNGWIADKFNTTPSMSTSLLAFIISDFDYTENMTKYGVQYRAWSRPEYVSQTQYALKVGIDIITFFEDYFQLTFPLPKQDMIAIPDFSAGAMENWGLITYRESAMLYDPVDSSETNKQRVAAIISHELAHQWFGNLVTPLWWDDLWLNEGFANFVEYIGVDHIHKDWLMFDQFVLALQDVFNIDGLVTSHPVYVPVGHPDEITEIFDGITYDKGSSIIRMMSFFLGEGTFQRGLTNYLTSLQYGAANHDDLWFSLGNQSEKENKSRHDVKEIMDTWTLQMNYPVVMVTRDSNNRISIRQKRYLRDQKAVDPGTYVSPFNYKWEIPFTYTTSESPTFNQTDNSIVWMRKTDTSVSIELSTPLMTSQSWMIGNVMQYGYYRVNYDDANWNSLINQLNTNHLVIHAVNRAQIINDAWNLAISGDLSMSIALSTVGYLDKERDYIVWKAATRELTYVDSMLERTSLYGKFFEFMRSKLQDPFNSIGLNNTDTSHLQSFLRSIISEQACFYDIPACVNEARNLFSLWRTGSGNNPIDPSVRETVYCTAIKYGSVEDWDFAFAQFKISNSVSEKKRLMSALACSRETWILSRYLTLALKPDEIRKQNANTVLGDISRNPIGRSLAWDFVRANWDYLFYVYGSGFFSFTSLVEKITKKFNTKYDLYQLEDFIEKHPNLGTGTRAFQQAVEKTKSNMKWMEKNYPILEDWLKDY